MHQRLYNINRPSRSTDPNYRRADFSSEFLKRTQSEREEVSSKQKISDHSF